MGSFDGGPLWVSPFSGPLRHRAPVDALSQKTNTLLVEVQRSDVLPPTSPLYHRDSFFAEEEPASFVDKLLGDNLLKWVKFLYRLNFWSLAESRANRWRSLMFC
ncbi:hypothetical protein SUGI_0920330 [Cryptomeria japonica]|nr:hypothetical protein SUGI_0920330 [Cryptomeria japonica]